MNVLLSGGGDIASAARAAKPAERQRAGAMRGGAGMAEKGVTSNATSKAQTDTPVLAASPGLISPPAGGGLQSPGAENGVRGSSFSFARGPTVELPAEQHQAPEPSADELAARTELARLTKAIESAPGGAPHLYDLSVSAVASLARLPLSRALTLIPCSIVIVAALAWPTLHCNGLHTLAMCKSQELAPVVLRVRCARWRRCQAPAAAEVACASREWRRRCSACGRRACRRPRPALRRGPARCCPRLLLQGARLGLPVHDSLQLHSPRRIHSTPPQR